MLMFRASDKQIEIQISSWYKTPSYPGNNNLEHYSYRWRKRQRIISPDAPIEN